LQEAKKLLFGQPLVYGLWKMVPEKCIYAQNFSNPVRSDHSSNKQMKKTNFFLWSTHAVDEYGEGGLLSLWIRTKVRVAFSHTQHDAEEKRSYRQKKLNV